MKNELGPFFEHWMAELAVNLRPSDRSIPLLYARQSLTHSMFPCLLLEDEQASEADIVGLDLYCKIA
ncbi:hypothetical protein JQ629_22910 [Bradyrhizobium sp. AUGA SZCCT0222]|uniref:hypothetical protein n=1 Tax=Bradyrhizobium sp. AUGA SZCCT0222 TaxID=2807668 RepID=UPI001BA4E0F3|nr:hypothetical protein [Bradyrhizobium sp. AUGA SZCCT0222]MBR1270330.1 hypothetical protein [Bradyrhizobium sp. AUGA SZCCT0222]